MSVHITSWVWKNSPAKGADRLLLLALADIADHDGFAWPGVDCLAVHCRLDDRTSVQRGLKRLIDAGCITFEAGRTVRGRGRKNVYRVVCPPPDERAASTQPKEKGGVHAALTVSHEEAPQPIVERAASTQPKERAASTQPETALRAAFPQEKGCVSAGALRKEPLRTGTEEPTTPLTPRSGGDDLKLAEKLALVEALFRVNWQGRLNPRDRREVKHLLRAGESPSAVLAWLAPKPVEAWEPPDNPGAMRVWYPVLDRLRGQSGGQGGVSEHSFTTWMLPLRAVAFRTDADGETLTLAGPSRDFQTACRENYGQSILTAMRALAPNARLDWWTPSEQIRKAA